MAYFQRGQCYFFLDNFHEALIDLDAAIEMNPEFPEAYYFRGATLKQLGQEQNAISDINTAIELDPQSESIPAVSELLDHFSTQQTEELNSKDLTNKIIDLENEVKRLGRLYSGILGRIAGIV